MTTKSATEGSELMPGGSWELSEPQEAGCCATLCRCLNAVCTIVFNLPFVHTLCLVVSIVAASAAVSGDHTVEDNLSRYGLNTSLTSYIYVVLAWVTVLNGCIVASAQYINSYNLLKTHRLERPDADSLERCYSCIDDMGNCFVGLTRLAFLVAYLTALGLMALSIATGIVAIVIEVLHLLCDKTSIYVVFAVLEGLQQLPIGLDFKLESIDDVEAFCVDINRTNDDSLKAGIFTFILAVSQVTIAICAWNTLLLLKFRRYVQEEDAISKLDQNTVIN